MQLYGYGVEVRLPCVKWVAKVRPSIVNIRALSRVDLAAACTVGNESNKVRTVASQPGLDVAGWGR